MGKESPKDDGPTVTPRNRLAQLIMGKTTEEGDAGGRTFTHTPGLVDLGYRLYRLDRAVGTSLAELTEAALRKSQELAGKATGRAPSDPSTKGEESGQPGHTGKLETGEGGDVSRTFPRGTELGSGGIDPKGQLYVGPDGTVSNQPPGPKVGTVGKIFALFGKGVESIPHPREPESTPRNVPTSTPSKVTNYPGYHYHGTKDPETGKHSGYRDPMVAPQTAESPQQPQPGTEREAGSHPGTNFQENTTVPANGTHEPGHKVDDPPVDSEPGAGGQESSSGPNASPQDPPVTSEGEPTERLPQQDTVPNTLPDDTTPPGGDNSSADGDTSTTEKPHSKENLPPDGPTALPVEGELFPVKADVAEPEQPVQKPEAVPGELFSVEADVTEPEQPEHPAVQPDSPATDPPIEP
ncbi:MAG: hypothetical protein ACR2LN_00165 [Candidatus Levyibacteriota bacterium]